MTERNKQTLIKFAKILCLVIIGFVALITNVEIWNVASDGGTDGFHVVLSIINLLLEGAAIFFFGKWLFKK